LAAGGESADGQCCCGGDCTDPRDPGFVHHRTPFESFDNNAENGWVAVIIRRLGNCCQAQQNNESVAHVRIVRVRMASMVSLWQPWETPSIRCDVEIFRPCSNSST